MADIAPFTSPEEAASPHPKPQPRARTRVRRSRPYGYWSGSGSLQRLNGEVAAFIASAWLELPAPDEPNRTYFYNQVSGRTTWRRPPVLQRPPTGAEAPGAGSGEGAVSGAGFAAGSGAGSGTGTGAGAMAGASQRGAAGVAAAAAASRGGAEGGLDGDGGGGGDGGWDAYVAAGAAALATEARGERVMPSQALVLKAGRTDLHSAVVSHGGYTQVASLLHRRPTWQAVAAAASASAASSRGQQQLLQDASGQVDARALRRELVAVGKRLGLPAGLMPTAVELRGADAAWLLAAVRRAGGFCGAAVATGLTRRRPAPASSSSSSGGPPSSSRTQQALDPSRRCQKSPEGEERRRRRPTGQWDDLGCLAAELAEFMRGQGQASGQTRQQQEQRPTFGERQQEGPPPPVTSQLSVSHVSPGAAPLPSAAVLPSPSSSPSRLTLLLLPAQALPPPAAVLPQPPCPPHPPPPPPALSEWRLPTQRELRAARRCDLLYGMTKHRRRLPQLAAAVAAVLAAAAEAGTGTGAAKTEGSALAAARLTASPPGAAAAASHKSRGGAGTGGGAGATLTSGGAGGSSVPPLRVEARGSNRNAVRLGDVVSALEAGHRTPQTIRAFLSARCATRVSRQHLTSYLAQQAARGRIKKLRHGTYGLVGETEAVGEAGEAQAAGAEVEGGRGARGGA